MRTDRKVTYSLLRHSVPSCKACKSIYYPSLPLLETCPYERFEPLEKRFPLVEELAEADARLAEVERKTAAR